MALPNAQTRAYRGPYGWWLEMQHHAVQHNHDINNVQGEQLGKLARLAMFFRIELLLGTLLLRLIIGDIFYASGFLYTRLRDFVLGEVHGAQARTPVRRREMFFRVLFVLLPLVVSLLWWQSSLVVARADPDVKKEDAAGRVLRLVSELRAGIEDVDSTAWVRQKLLEEIQSITDSLNLQCQFFKEQRKSRLPFGYSSLTNYLSPNQFFLSGILTATTVRLLGPADTLTLIKFAGKSAILLVSVLCRSSNIMLGVVNPYLNERDEFLSAFLDWFMEEVW